MSSDSDENRVTIFIPRLASYGCYHLIKAIYIILYILWEFDPCLFVFHAWAETLKYFLLPDVRKENWSVANHVVNKVPVLPLFLHFSPMQHCGHICFTLMQNSPYMVLMSEEIFLSSSFLHRWFWKYHLRSLACSTPHDSRCDAI